MGVNERSDVRRGGGGVRRHLLNPSQVSARVRGRAVSGLCALASVRRVQVCVRGYVRVLVRVRANVRARVGVCASACAVRDARTIRAHARARLCESP